MPITVGSVQVDIYPSTTGIRQRLIDGLVPPATEAGKEAGEAAGKAFGPAMASGTDSSVADAVGQRIGNEIAGRITAQIRDAASSGLRQGGATATAAATRQGEESGGAFARALKARLTAAYRSMPRLDVGLNDTGLDADLARLRARLESLAGRRIGVDIDVTAADAEITDISERLERLGAAHPNIAVRADTEQARRGLDEIRAEIDRLSGQPAILRVETDGTFGARLRAAVRAAEAGLPDIEVGANTSPAQAELASLRAQLTALRDARVGIDIDAATATARIEEIGAQLGALAASSPDVAIRIDAGAAEARLAQITAQIAALDAAPAAPEPAQASQQGDEAGGAFARALRARLTAAYRTMPRLDIGLADTGVDADLARLRARLESLAGRRIGVDIDVAAADAQIADITARLQTLGAAHPNVAVRADAAQARAVLDEIRAEIERVSGQPATVRVEIDGSFGARLRAAVRAAEADLPDIAVNANTDAAQAQLASLRSELTALRDARVGIDIDAATGATRIEEIRAQLATLAASSPDVAIRIDAGAAEARLAQVTAQIAALDAAPAAPEPAQAARQGDEAGGAFARALRARLTEAYRSMPHLDVGLADTGVDAELARLRARLEDLAGRRIGVDVDVATADAAVAEISARLQRLGALHPNIAVRADTVQAREALDAVREEIARVTARPGEVRLETDGSFGARLRASVQAAEAALPNITIRADTDQAQAELAGLRAQLTALRDARVGIDIDAATAQARVDAIRAQLVALGASSPDIAVRVDAAAAEAQLAQVAAVAEALDARSVNLRVNNGQALAAIFQVSVAWAALAALPAIPVLAAGAGGLIASFTAAGVGAGAFAAAALPAITQVKGALDAQKQAQDAANTATAKSGQAAAQAASRSLQLAGAQQALASAERTGAEQIVRAQQQVAQARQAVADAIQQAAQRQQQADRAVQTAEQQLTQAQQTAKQAQLDLVTARRTAAEQLVDLNNQLTDSQLSQKNAALQLQQAQINLNQVLADPRASALQRAEAQLAYEQAKQQLSEQTTATQRLQTQTAAANKAGVTGSATYTQAQQALVAAQDDVAAKTQALKDARDQEAQTEVQNARAIADAQQRVIQAEQGVADAQAQAADSIASAQRQIQSAQLSAAGATDTAATAQQKYQQALAKLSPAATDTFNAFTSLRTAFKAWSLALQPQVMPIFTRGIDGLKNSLPGLTPLVQGAAAGISTLQDKVSRGFKSPWWNTLKTDFQTSVEPAIVGVGTAVGGVFVGIAGIVDAFLPHIDGFVAGMDRATGRFGRFGKGLRGSPAFENFLDYAAKEGPVVGRTIGDIASAFTNVGEALGPLAGVGLHVLDATARTVSSIADTAPGVVQLLYGAYLATKLWTIAQVAYNAAMTAYKVGVVLVTLVTDGWAAAQEAANAAELANPAVAIIVAIIAVIVLLVAGILYAWNHWAWFRDAVKAVWAAILFSIHAVVDWFWSDFLPFFTKTLPGWFTWLLNWVKGHWQLILAIIAGPVGLAVYAIKKYWGQIESFFSDSWSWLKKYIFNPIGNFFTSTIPGWADTMGSKVTSAFDSLQKGIARLWGKIEDATKTPINFVIQTIWNDGIRGVWAKIGGWIPGLPKLGKLDKLAAGGTLPVRPGVFNQPTAIVGEGNPRHPEYVIPTDPKYRARALGLYQQAGAQLLSGGGIIGTVTGTVTGVAKDVGGAVASGAKDAWRGITTAAQFLKDPVGNLVHLLSPWMDKLKDLDKTGWGKMIAGLPRAAVDGLKGLVGLGGGGGGHGAIPSGQHARIITQALAAAHVPPPGTVGQWLAGLNTLIGRESGWRANAINRWDSNALKGIPSQGLTQVVPPTFAHYVPAALRRRGILDPVANVAAAIRYIVARYGDIGRVQQANPNLPPKGYDSGGLLQPGLNLAYNGTGRPEPVFTTAQANALLRGGTAPAGGLQQGQAVTLLVQDGPTLRAYVADVADSQVGAALTTVRRVAANH